MMIENAIVARICHDLISPINAINLGIDALDAEYDKELLKYIKQSIDKTNIILRFTRELFSEKNDTFNYSLKFLNDTLSSFLGLVKISFKMQLECDKIPAIVGKIIMLTCMVVKEIMPYGGDIYCSINEESGEIITECNGKNVAIPDMNNLGEINSRNVIRFYLMQILKELNFNIAFESSENSLKIRAKLV